MSAWLDRFSRLAQNTFVRSVALVTSGTVAGQAIMVAVSPLLSRLYGPQDFGAFAVVASTVGILAVLASLRYEIAIPLPPNECGAWALARLALVAATTVSVLLLLSAWLWGAYYLEALGLAANQMALAYLIPLGVMFTSLYQISNYLVIRQRRHDLLAKGKVVQGGTAAALQTSLGYTALGSMGLVLGMVLGRLAAAIYALTRLERTPANCISIREIARRYIRFPKLALPSGGINALSVEIPMLLSSSLFGTSTAGYYALAQRVVVAPLSMVGKSISQVYMSSLGERVRERDPAVVQLFTGVANRLLLLAAPPFILLGLFSPVLFKTVFGEGWYPAGMLVRVLVPAFLAQFVVVPLSQTLNFIGRQDYQLAWDALRFAGVFASFTITHHLNLNYIYAFTTLSAFLVLAYGVHYLLMLTALRNAAASWQTDEGEKV